MSKIKREFKGIWIPAEIWLHKNLSIQEKVFLAEIMSLSKTKKGCFASNSHFANFFEISPSRCSQIINELANKGLIHIELVHKDKQVIKRIIIPLIGVVDILNRGVVNILKGGISDIAKIDIQRKNNTEEKKNIKKEKFVTPSNFEEFWKLYHKGTKSKALQAWLKICELPIKSTKVSRPKWKEIKKSVNSQFQSERWSKQPEYIPHTSSWINGYMWLNDADDLKEIKDFNTSKRNNSVGYQGGYKVTKESIKM